MRYGSIERKLLVLVNGHLKYHHYLHGRRFVYKSDHQYLEKSTWKYFSVAPPRLQRLLLTIQPYDFEIKHIPGKEIALADVGSKVNLYMRWSKRVLFQHTWINPMLDTKTYVNDMCGTEEWFNKEVIDPESASRKTQVLQRGRPRPQDIGPWDMISPLRMPALHTLVICLFHQTYGNIEWFHCIGVIQGDV